MKTKILVMLTCLMISFTSGYSQLNKEKRKKFREERKIQLKQKVDQLMESKNFVFKANKALPMGGSAIDLTTSNNSVKFSPERIFCYMPFFGEAYNIDYRGDPGIKFDTKPQSFEIQKQKNGKGYDVKARVSIPRDNINMRLAVGDLGTSTLTILTDQRKSISYSGYITDPEQVAPDRIKK